MAKGGKDSELRQLHRRHDAGKGVTVAASVPAPSTFPLVATGLGLIALLWLRKKARGFEKRSGWPRPRDGRSPFFIFIEERDQFVS
jgi:hypothetical protein